jgi:hypothetical protein
VTTLMAGVDKRQEGERGLSCTRGGARMGERAKRGHGVGQRVLLAQRVAGEGEGGGGSGQRLCGRE